MQQVSFPGLGLHFTLSRIAFYIGSIPIYWYAIFIVIAFLIFLIAMKKESKMIGIEYNTILDLMVYVIPISLVCARIYYILFDLKDFTNIWDIINIRKGGLAIYGGILGGIITIFVFCYKRKIDVLKVLDLIAPYLALGQSIGRWGNFVNVEAYGETTSLLWRMQIEKNGFIQEVHPTFLYESIATFFLFLFLTFYKKKKQFHGEVTCLYIIFYSIVRIFIEKMRTDSLMVNGVRISEVLSIFLFVTFCSIFAYQRIKLSKKKQKVKK